MAKYRDFMDRPTMPKMEAVRLLCKDPKDQSEISSLRKAVERAAAKDELEIHRVGIKGAGRNAVCLDTVATQPFFQWAAKKWPEIESDDHLGPILTRHRTLSVGADVLIDPALDLPDDPAKAVKHLLAEREELLRKLCIAEVRIRDLEAEVDRLRPYEAKFRDWNQKKSASLSGKRRIR